ncbi:dipeptide ABC transporter ATP-binding protein [Nocardioides maradonensis]
MSPLLEVTGLTKTFGTRRRPGTKALVSVDFAVNAGEIAGLVGESGSGKSTFTRCMLGLTRPDAGSVTYDGIDVLAAGKADRVRLRREIQLVFQDPYASLNPRMTVEESISEGLVIHRLVTSRAECRARVAEMLEIVGLDARDASAHPRSFSGGQRQRIAIARALVMKPRVLVCDEPVSALDVSVQAQIINLIAELRRELDLTVVFIAHDLALVKHLCDHLTVLHAGTVAEAGTSDDVFNRPSSDYTKSLLEAVATPNPRLERQRRRGRADVRTQTGARG